MLAALFFSFPAEGADYVGAEKYSPCHMEQYNDWQASGHPWKFRKAEKACYAKLPLPPGYTWDDISYVIGGATKKARYIDNKGYITPPRTAPRPKPCTTLEDGSWSSYHPGEKKPYDCGPCHMTAYSPEGLQDNREGIIGTWAEDGISCEEYHGPGGDHLRNPTRTTISIDRSAEACGKCHQRGGIGPEPPARGGFIQHHEQINELKAGVHKNLTCTTCHTPIRGPSWPRTTAPPAMPRRPGPSPAISTARRA